MRMRKRRLLLPKESLGMCSSLSQVCVTSDCSQTVLQVMKYLLTSLSGNSLRAFPETICWREIAQEQSETMLAYASSLIAAGNADIDVSFCYNPSGTRWSEVEIPVSPNHQPKRLQWKTSGGSIWRWKSGTWGLTTRSSSSTRLFLETQRKIATHSLRGCSGFVNN